MDDHGHANETTRDLHEGGHYDAATEPFGPRWHRRRLHEITASEIKFEHTGVMVSIWAQNAKMLSNSADLKQRTETIRCGQVWIFGGWKGIDEVQHPRVDV